MTKSPKYKDCSKCGQQKHETEFSKNQYRKGDIIVRRAYCKTCESKKKGLSSSQKQAYYAVHPRPELGKPFKCPVCRRTQTPWHPNQVCLDHNHKTGKIRGYLCGDCNASIGRMAESINTFKRAILWLQGRLND